MTSTRLPALFLGHGSPMNVITPSPEHANWIALGQALPRPRAILAVSAHWETSGASHVTSAWKTWSITVRLARRRSESGASQ